VSEDAAPVPGPYILDVSVLTAVARADAAVTSLILALDARGQPLMLPALAMTAGSLDTRSEDADDALRGLERLENAEVASLRDAEQAAHLAGVIARTGLDPWDAHVAAVADVAICPILTLDAAKWREHSASLAEQLHIIHIADPDASPGDTGSER
jgi:predicted nucleic acid-binding protein